MNSASAHRPGWLRGASSLRLRLAAIVLIAAIPLLILGGVTAQQNYALRMAAGAEAVERLRAAAIARHVSAIDSVGEIMQSLSQMADWQASDRDQCDHLLRGVLALSPARYTALAVYGSTGKVRCSARPLSAAARAAMEIVDEPLIAAARTRSGLVLGPVRASVIEPGERIIPAIYPVSRAGQQAGYLFAGLRMDWFAQTDRASLGAEDTLWLIDATGQVSPVARRDPLALPTAAVMADLLASKEAITASSTGGAPYAYASASLGYGYRMLVGYAAFHDLANARQLLMIRLGELALLLLLGLAAVAVGAHLALIGPLNQLRAAVARSLVTGTVDVAGLYDAPIEIIELAQAFAASTQNSAEQAARAREAMRQQDLLIKEIHHRVKNNLQIVASLLNLQAARIRVPEARAEFAAARDRVRALATVHRHLYGQGEVHSIHMRGFLTELCEQLFNAMQGTEVAHIKLTVRADDLSMSSDKAVPLALIMTETITNSLKYAFPDGRLGHVNVSLTGYESDAELIIEDDGIGMPAANATEPPPRRGIGLQLIQGFARQLNASLTMRPGQGTGYVLRIPLIGETRPDDLIG